MLSISKKILARTGASVPFSSKIYNAGLGTTTRGFNTLKVDDINQNIRRLEYAVRGPLVTRAVQINKELASGVEKPFKSLIRANIGDYQALGQKPITFIRQVVSCAANPKLLSSPDIPNDVKERTRELLSGCEGGSVGAYTDSFGLEVVRRHIADYITERDGGIESDWQNIYLCGGASEAVKSVLALINNSRKPGLPVGVMMCKPQYPLYSATFCEYGQYKVDYLLNEDREWALDIEELSRAYEEAHEKCDIRAIVVINPGNPTGSVLTEQNIIEIINFAAERKLMIMADEVYQHNVYDQNAKFHSFKKVMFEKTNHRIELASLMSASKGYMSECGLRGGYCELANFSQDVRDIFYKGQSSWLCTSTLGQIVMDTVVNPPKPGMESYELFAKEKKAALDGLSRNAKLVADTFNSVEGIKSNPVAGAMYAFPKIELPKKAIEEAKSLNYLPDFYYVLQFLEKFGVCVVAGSGFGQKEGTHHFRTTILLPPDVFEDMMDRFKRFHVQFLTKYS